MLLSVSHCEKEIRPFRLVDLIRQGEEADTSSRSNRLGEKFP